MKKRKKVLPQALAILLLSSSFQINPSIALASPSPSTSIEKNETVAIQKVNENNKQSELDLAREQMKKAGSYPKQRQLVEDAIQKFKEDQTTENLKKVIHLLLVLPIPTNSNNESEKVNFTNTILTLSNFIPENERNALLSYFAKEAITITQQTKLVWDFKMAETVVQKLPDEKQKNTYLSWLQRLEPQVYDKKDPKTGYIDWDNEDDIFDSHIDHAKDNFKPGYNANIIQEMLKRPKDNVPTFSTGTFWIKPSKEFQHIDIPEPEARQKKWERLFNGILNGYNQGLSDSGRTDASNSSDASAFESSLTIQYTFDVHSDSPYFYDTGIRIRKDYTIEYDKAKDALYQIAIHSNGRFVEDNNRVLGVIDGRIIVIEDKGKLIPVSEFLNLFNVVSNAVKVKILDTRIGQSKTLVDLVETKGVTTVWVNNQEIELNNPAIVDNSIVLFPIKDIAKALGGKVEQEDKQTTVTFNGNRLVFKDGKSYALYNNHKVSLKVPTRITQKGVRVASIYPILNMFNASISVDTKTNRVIITTK